MQSGIHLAAREVAKIKDMTACQIFVMSPQQLREVAYDAEELRRAAKHINIWIHSSYLVSPWGAKPYNLPFCVKQLQQQVAIAARGVVFHLPKAPAATLAGPLRTLLSRRPRGSRVILENKAVRPDARSYETPEKINALVETFVQSGIVRRDIWFAIDTAHLYCSGVDLRTRDAAERWLAALKYPDRIALFHLNGCSSATFADRHAIAFGPEDRIWRGQSWSESGAAAIAEFCSKRKIDIILECDYVREKKYARGILNKLKKI